MRTHRYRILFVCTGNAGRSQMAEALFRRMAGNDNNIEIFSAGVEPWDDVHPMARKLMQQQSIDMSSHSPKHVNTFVDNDFDIVITIGDRAEKETPEFRACPRRIYWDISDPADADGTPDSEKVFRWTRDQIAKRLPDLYADMKSFTYTRKVSWQPAISTIVSHPEPFRPEKDIPEYIKAGFKILELGFYDKNAFPYEDAEQIKKIRQIANDVGIKIWSVHPPDIGNLSASDSASVKAQLETIKRFVDIAQELGAYAIPLHAGIKLADEAERSKSVKILQESLQELAEYVRATPVTLCLETLQGKSDDLSNGKVCEEARKASQSSFGIVIDTGHCNMAGDLYGMAQLAGRRLCYLHIHDNDGKHDQHKMPRKGTIDWKQFISELQSAEYCGPLMLEVAPRIPLSDALAEAKQAAEYLLTLRE